MKIRADIAELLREGVPQIQICRRLHCSPLTVQRTREALGIPSPGPGRRASAPKDLAEALRAHSTPGEDGHVMWTGWTNSDGTPLVCAQNQQPSAYRVAFVVHHGREPVGRVTPGCRVQGCVRGDHMADQPIREANKRADRAFGLIFRESE